MLTHTLSLNISSPRSVKFEHWKFEPTRSSRCSGGNTSTKISFQESPVLGNSQAHVRRSAACRRTRSATDGPGVPRRRRASSAAPSIHPGEVWTPLVAELPHDVGLYMDLNQEDMLDDHEWAGSAHCR
jgi:hypothetical protein